ncbi:MAG: hypothetical protein AABW83_02305, partial [Nanoarchaeota archaeon]
MAGKKKRLIERSESKSIPRIKDFQIFAKGVERLEEIERELNSLNTKGYEQEASSIRSKLKNVSYIPQIENELRDLKDKINGNYKKKVSASNRNIYKKIKELKKSIPDEHYKIHKKIKELEGHVINNDNFAKKINEIKKDISLVKDMPKIQNQIKSLKKFIDSYNEEEKKKKEILKKIDPKVNLLVNNKFNLSLNEIKAELSKRINDKESEIKKQLHDDLDTRKKIFKEQYNNLEKNFEEKYRDKLKKSLDNEIRTKFDEALKRKINFVKGDIKKELVSKNKKEIEMKKSIIASRNEKKLDEFIIRKKSELEEEYDNNLIESKKKMVEHFHDMILAHQTVINNKMHEKLTSKVSEINKNYNGKLKIVEEEKNKALKSRESFEIEKKKLNEED